MAYFFLEVSVAGGIPTTINVPLSWSMGAPRTNGKFGAFLLRVCKSEMDFVAQQKYHQLIILNFTNYHKDSDVCDKAVLLTCFQLQVCLFCTIN